MDRLFIETAQEMHEKHILKIKNADRDVVLDYITDLVMDELAITNSGYMFNKIRGIIERNCKF